MSSWRKAWKYIQGDPMLRCLVLTSGITAVAGPLVIMALYALHGCIVTPWDEAGALGYYGSCLCFAGALFIGLVSLYQNHTLRKEQEKETLRQQRTIDSLLNQLKWSRVGHFELSASGIKSRSEANNASAEGDLYLDLDTGLRLINQSGTAVNLLGTKFVVDGMLASSVDGNETATFFSGDGGLTAALDYRHDVKSLFDPNTSQHEVILELRLETVGRFRYCQRLRVTVEEPKSGASGYRVTSYNIELEYPDVNKP